MLQGFFRSNYAILGIPLVNYICGDNATGTTSLMVAVVVPLFNLLATISLEKFRNNDVNMTKLISGVFKNPLIIGCLIGALFLIFKIKLPVVIDESVNKISVIASPFAIISLGAGFTFSNIRNYAKETFIVVFVRLIFVPMIIRDRRKPGRSTYSFMYCSFSVRKKSCADLFVPYRL